LKHCRFETLKKDSIIFYTEHTEKFVYIITKGTIIVKDHSSNIEVPRTAIQMQPGDVINPGDSDGGLLKSFHFWFRCSTEIEAIVMSRESFDNFWFAQTSFGLDTTCMVFKKMDLFANVSQATVFKIVYDLMEVRSFDQPTVLYDDLSYFDTYEEHRKREYEKKLKNPKNQLALDYLKYALLTQTQVQRTQQTLRGKRAGAPAAQEQVRSEARRPLRRPRRPVLRLL